MAKTIKNKDGRVIRVSNDEAVTRVKTGDWKYCPKSEFKRQEARNDKA